MLLLLSAAKREAFDVLLHNGDIAYDMYEVLNRKLIMF